MKILGVFVCTAFVLGFCSCSQDESLVDEIASQQKATLNPIELNDGEVEDPDYPLAASLRGFGDNEVEDPDYPL